MLVFAALIGAMSLAMVSPSDPDPGTHVGAVTASPQPSAPTDGRLPTEQPEIRQPKDGLTTPEREMPVTVAVPPDPLPLRLLTLEILRDGQKLGEVERPAEGDVTVEGVRLLEGTNIITAALRGPGGLGPLSDPIAVVLDLTATPLTITAPATKETTIEPSILLAGTSEPGASVTVRNANKDWENPTVVGPAGTFDMNVPLVDGKNRIVVTSVDAAGNRSRERIVVTRRDGRPLLKATAPKNVRVSALPTNVKVQVEVKDANGKTIEGADVVFAVTIPGRSSETNEDQTNASGRVVWKLPIPKGSSREDVILITVVATAPNGLSRENLVQITVV